MIDPDRRGSGDPSDFKRAMRQVPGGVAVITSRNGNTRNGMTATAFCSVSIDPPMMLVVVNRSSNSHPIIESGGVFAVNMLKFDQTHIAEIFASREGKSFDDIGYRDGVTGCPVITGCVANVECLVDETVKGGTHTIFVGRVVSAITMKGSPLIYCNGSFAKVEENV